MLKPTATAPHPAGGRLEFFTLPNGRLFSMLEGGEDKFPYFEDVEIHERATELDRDADGFPDVIPNTEQRAETRAEALALIEAAAG